MHHLDELRTLIRLATPIVTVQLGLMAMNTVDVMMVGRLSEEALAAATLGNIWVWGLIVFCMGVVMAADPLISQAMGAGDERAVTSTVQRGLCITVLLSVPCALLVLPIESALTFLQQPAAAIPGATAYAHVSILSILPFLLFTLFRQALQADGILRPLVLTILLANGINVLLNWLLIFGNWGCPALGIAGSAWATVASRWFTVLLLPLLAWRHLGRHLWPLRPSLMKLRPILAMLRLGLPIGTQFILEMGAFAATGFLMGYLGTREVAGHQVALNLAALTFMAPVGLSIAASVRVGRAVGRGDGPGIASAAITSLVLAAAVMATFGILFLTAPSFFAALYTNQPRVLQLAAVLIPIAGVFQVFDGLQGVAVGVLRGMADTRVPMLFIVMGFWLLGLPIGVLLCFGFDLGPAGLWWGLVVGLATVSICLVLRVRLMLRRDIGRVRLD